MGVRIGAARLKVGSWFAAHRKAIAGLIVPLVVFIAAHNGLDLSGDWSAILSALLSGAAVHTVPNNPPEGN